MTKRQDYISWDEYFMGIALLSAERSKDPNTQVGACVVNQDNKIVSVGYNGMPLGVSDDDFPWEREGSFLDTKYPYVCHAELNAILNNPGISLKNCSIYVPLFPCNECCKAIIQSGIKKVLYLCLPVFIGVAINDLNSIIDRTLASSLVSGSISALNYANRLNSLILGVFISAITTVIFPLLAKEFNNNNIEGMKKVMAYGVNMILLITIPATVGLIVLAKPIVEVAFERGEFDAVATIMTSQALIFYSLGLVAMSLRLLITKVYYSLQDTKTTMINGAISVGFNIVLNLILVKFMAHAGLAFATSIATTIATLLMFYGLKKKIGSLGTKNYIITFAKSGLASAIMGVVAYVIYNVLYDTLGVSKLSNLISLLSAAGVGVIIYGVLCYVFGIEEVREIVEKVKKIIIKRKIKF